MKQRCPGMRLAMILLAFWVTGCIKVGPDYERPSVEAPSAWRYAEPQARDATNLPWWEQLGDPVLNHLVQRGIRNNLDLRAAVANVDQFMGLYGATRANLFPQIFGGADYSRRQESVLSGALSETDTDLASLGATMQWELDVWGGLRRAKEAAQADLLAQEAVKRGIILTLASSIAQTYVQLRAYDKDLDITRRISEALKEELRIRQVRLREGFTSELEVSQAESEYQRRSALIPFYEQNIAQTEHALSVLLGSNPGNIERGKSLDELKLPSVPAGLPSDLLNRRPDIQQAEQALIAANARIGVARALYFPRISLTGDIGQVSAQVATLFTPGANFWSIGTAVLTPIFTAGKIAGQVRAAESIQQAALAQYQNAIINAFREFEDGLIGQTKTRERSERQSQRIAAVETYYRLSKVRYDEGYSSYLVLLDSIRNLYDAQIDQVQAHAENFAALIGLYRAMGGGWIVNAEPLAQPEKSKAAAFFP